MTDKFLRKVFIYILSIFVGFGASFVMTDSKFEIFFVNIVYLAIGFFISNTGEHFAKAIKNRKGNQEDL
jgi:hypothetical protein